MNANSPPEVSRLVDLERYPVHALDSPRGAALVTRWQDGLDATGVCNLPGFLTAEGVRVLAAEAEALMPGAYHRTFTSNFMYQGEASPDLPDDHPARRFWTTSSLHLASDQFGPGSKLRQLYEWDAVTDLVARIQRKERLYRDADEFQALNVIALEEGDRTIFHHDQVECVVTLLLQEPVAGGEFVFSPDTRDRDWVVDVEAVRRVVAGEPGRVRELERGEGTLTLFRGGHSLHGVNPVRGSRRRISAILSYDERPDRVGKDASNIRLYGPRVERIVTERRHRRTADGAAPPV